MQLLVRKINRSKWNNADDNIFNLSSDAITSCLRTSSKTLSVWKISTEEDLNEAVLAIVSNFQKLEAIDVVILDGEYLIKATIEQEQTNGITPVSDLVESHIDLKNLNYYKIGLVSEHIVQRIKSNKVKRYTIAELKDLIRNAIEQDRLKIEDLNESIAVFFR